MGASNKILIVGGGGREHALAWRCASEGAEVLAAPGSDAIAEVARCVAPQGEETLADVARREAVDAVVVGPEQPLVDGLADSLRAAGVPVVGPSARAAELEGSKAASKAFMAAHDIPTARHVTVTSLEAGLQAIGTFSEPPVVKASGLAAGKGVTVPETFAEAEAALRECLLDARFGAAGQTVVLEERMRGEEASFFVLSDGERFVQFAPCQDHKRIGDGDQGPNTGGMGAYAPAPVCDARVSEAVVQRIVKPTLVGLREEGRPFVGILFVGLMIEGGEPRVVEYNVRFGDPEAQPLMLGLDTPLVPHLLAAANGRIEPGVLPCQPAATVVMASAGYPQTSTKGVLIEGLADAAEVEGVRIFHAGTRKDGDRWLTNGGRVLGVCARGDSLRAAIGSAYDAAGRIRIEGGQMRSDIGARALR